MLIQFLFNLNIAGERCYREHREDWYKTPPGWTDTRNKGKQLHYKIVIGRKGGGGVLHFRKFYCYRLHSKLRNPKNRGSNFLKKNFFLFHNRKIEDFVFVLIKLAPKSPEANKKTKCAGSNSQSLKWHHQTAKIFMIRNMENKWYSEKGK